MNKQDKDPNEFHNVEITNGSRSGTGRASVGRFFTDKERRVQVIRFLAFAFALMATLGIVVITLAKAEKGVRDPFNRTIGLRKIYYNVIKTTALTDVGLCACQPDRVDRVVLLNNGFETTVSIYDRGGPGPRPGIVLAHGNVWMGQRLSTYRVVAHFLAEAGFIVLTFDKIGFGESDDPFGQGPAAVAPAYDYVSQLKKAVEYLIAKTEVDPDRISLLGHSGGVDEVLELGRQSNQIANIVIWVAPFDPTHEDKVATQLTYLGNKFQASYELIYGRSVPDWFEWGLTGIKEEDPDVMWKYYRLPNHKPLILVLGEYDEPEAHDYVLDHFGTLMEPKDIVFVSRANHYLNTAQSLRWVFYDRKIVSELVGELMASLNQSSNK
jgi:acetyl esterase/lipase